MKIDAFSYNLRYAFSKFNKFIYLVIGIKSAQNLSKNLSNLANNPSFENTLSVLLDCGALTFCSYSAISSGLKKLFFLSEKEIVSLSIKNKYSLEYINKIQINDKDGLEHLLIKTKQGGFREWGGHLSIDCIDDVAIVKRIVSFEESTQLGLIDYTTPVSIRFNTDTKKRFNGEYHYHPTIYTKLFSAFNYSISLDDRNFYNANRIDFLLFNTLCGPELIAFNRNNLFLPTNDSKSYFICVSRKELSRYLIKK